MTASKSITPSGARTLLLACGIVAPLLYAGADLLAGMRWEGYSFRDMTISELGAIGAPTRWLFTALLLVVSVLQAAFGVGVWRSAAGKRSLRVVGGLLAGLGVMGLVTMPFSSTDLRTEGLSQATTIHIVSTTIGALLVSATMGFGAAAFGRWWCLYSIVVIVVMWAFAAWSGMDAARAGESFVTPWLGVKERISVYSYQAWFMVLALKLLRQHRAVSADSESGEGAVTAPA